MPEPILYLDTLHISSIARHPADVEGVEIVSLLRQGRARLAFSVLHMVELSDPGFKSFRDVCDLLDSLPIAWAILPPKLFDREVEAGFARAIGASPPVVRAFFDTPAAALTDLSLGTAPPSAALDAMREKPQLRDMLLEEAVDHARTYDLIKTRAAAVQRPLEPLLARIRDQQLRTTPAGLHLLQPMPPEIVLERAGGLRAFPAFEVYQSLNVTRLKDKHYKTPRNTIFDEWHAIYSPYVSVMALDKATARRFRQTRLPATAKVAENLDEVSRLLAATFESLGGSPPSTG